MQAIRVKYLSATDNKPARLKAICESGGFGDDTFFVIIE
jgi:uncharacterized protein YgbK (DUF1537 family)